MIHNGGSAQDCSMSTEEQEDDEQSGQKYEELEEVTEQPGYRVSITMQLSIPDYTVLLCTCIGGFKRNCTVDSEARKESNFLYQQLLRYWQMFRSLIPEHLPVYNYHNS